MKPLATSCWQPPVVVERVFACGVVILAVVGGSALTLAEFNVFSRWLLAGVALPFALFSVWRIVNEPRLNVAGRRVVSHWHVGTLLACVLALLVLTGRPSEYLVDGSDASVYVNVAASIEHRGGIVTDEPLLADLDPDVREAVFDRDLFWPHLLNFLPGGIQISADEQLQPGFFHFSSAAMAGFSALFQSPSAGDLVTPFSSVLVAVGIWLLAVRLSSPVAATTAIVLLSVNFAQLWFSRFPSSEMITAALVVAGALFTVRAAQDASRLSGTMAGLVFGLAASTRLDAIVLVTPFVALYLIVVAVRRRWTPATTALAVAGGAFTAQAILHGIFVATPYTQRVLWRVFGTDWLVGRSTWLLPAVVAATALLAVFLSRIGRQWTRLPAVHVVASAVLLAVIVRSWPQLWSGSGAWLFTPVGLALMACGAVWLACDDSSPEALLVVALFVASAVAFVETRTSGLSYPFVWRRFVPIVLPIGMVLIGHVMAVLWRRPAPWRAVAPLVVAGLALTFASQSRVLLAETPMTGVRGQFNQMAASLPANSVVMTDASTPSHFALSLHFSFNQPVLLVRGMEPLAVQRVAHRILASGRTVVVATSPHAMPGGLLRSDLGAFDVVPIAGTVLRSMQLERVLSAVPTRMRTVEAPIEFYEVREAQPLPLPLTMDVGAADFRWRDSGFHALEQIGDASVRWTDGIGRVLVPRVEATDRARLMVRLAAPRPPGRPSPTISIHLGDQLLASVPDVPPEFTTIAIDLTKEAMQRLTSGPSFLELQSSFFVPRAEGLGDDPRQLGVLVDWFRIEAVETKSPAS